MYHIRHTALAAHRLEHIPEGHSAVCGQVLLVTDQVLDTGHGAQVAFFGFILAVAHADDEDTRLRKSVLQVGNGGCHAVAVAVVVPSAFRCDIQSVLKDYQIIRTLLVKFAHHPYGYGAQRQAGAAAEREVIHNNSLRAVHGQSVE